MEQLTGWLETAFVASPDTGTKIGISLLVIVLLWVTRIVGVRLVNARIDDIRLRYRTRKGFTYAAAVIGVLVIGALWLEGVRSLATFLGLFTAGLAIALKDLVENVAGWAFIVWRRPFRVGERIQIGEHSGDVIDIRLFQFSLLEIGNWVDADQSTGRVIHIPCGMTLREPLVNYSRGFHFIWNEIPVLVTFESDWRKAKDILAGIVARDADELSEEAQRRVREASQRYMIFYEKLTPTVYTRVEDSGVLLTMRYLCEPRRRRGTEEKIWEDVLDEFSLHPEIDFAYPTRRFFDNRTEGYPGSPDAASGSRREGGLGL
jgi:small-conductance mechanosensitive channel